MRTAVLRSFSFNLGYLKMLLNGIEGRFWTRQPSFEGHLFANHPLWQLGHLTVALDFAGSMLGLEKFAPSSYETVFGMGVAAVDDPARYPEPNLVLDTLARSHDRLAQAYTHAGEELLGLPHGVEGFPPGLLTRGDMATYIMISHEPTHIGQLIAWRRLMGFKPMF
jgi:hypothetical protein